MTKQDLEKLRDKLLVENKCGMFTSPERWKGFHRGWTAAVEALWPEVERLKEWSNTMGKEQNFQYQRAEKLQAEVERLRKILHKEFSENDELGAEHLGITMVRDENHKLRADLDFAVNKLELIIKVSGTSCLHYLYAAEALAKIQGPKG